MNRLYQNVLMLPMEYLCNTILKVAALNNKCFQLNTLCIQLSNLYFNPFLIRKNQCHQCSIHIGVP
jgi:hypothetical protein